MIIFLSPWLTPLQVHKPIRFTLRECEPSSHARLPEAWDLINTSKLERETDQPNIHVKQKETSQVSANKQKASAKFPRISNFCWSVFGKDEQLTSANSW